MVLQLNPPFNTIKAKTHTLSNQGTRPQDLQNRVSYHHSDFRLLEFHDLSVLEFRLDPACDVGTVYPHSHYLNLPVLGFVYLHSPELFTQLKFTEFKYQA